MSCWREFVAAYRERRPFAEERDVYKLIFQAHFGPGHAVADVVAARKRFEEEWDGLVPVTGEWLESIHPEGRMYRLHMAEAKGAGMNPGSVFEAFIASVRGLEKTEGAVAEFRSAIRDAGVGDAGIMEMAMRDEPPAIHHSPGYKKAYAPHYRVVAPFAVERFLRRPGAFGGK